MTVSPGVSPHDYAVREKRLVSFFGPQARSTKVSAPAFGFGSGTRDDTEKLYLSAEHARAIPGTCSPGPVYDPPSSVGAQPASIHPSAPAPSFDKTIRRLEKSNEWATQHVRHRDLLEGAEDFPGPCSYALPAAVGDQPLSQKASKPKCSVAKSTREQAGAVYQGVASEVPGRDAPPVGTYFHRDASKPGPFDASSSMGKQTDASKPTSPSAGFPRERRFAEKSQGRGFVKPGPGAHFRDDATAASPGDSPTGSVSGGSPTNARATPGSSSPLGRRSRGRGGGKKSSDNASFVASGGPSSVGKQTLSRSHTEPRSPGLGAATREARERVYVSRGHEKDLFGRIGPGPASPDFRASEWGLGSSLGRQRHSLAADQPSPTFPRSSRWGPADRGASEPGPGAYDA